MTIKEEDFMKVYNDFWDLLSQKNSFTPNELRVLAFLNRHSFFGGKITLTQTKIAEELNLPPTRISQAIKKLTDKKIVSKKENLYGKYFVLNNKFFSKGKDKRR